MAQAYLGLVALPDPALRDLRAPQQVRAAALRAQRGAARRRRSPACRSQPGASSRPAGSSQTRRASSRCFIRAAGWLSPVRARSWRRRPRGLRRRRSARPMTTRTTTAVLAAACVDVLGERRRRRVHDVQAGDPARRRHQPGPQAVIRQHLGETLEPVRCQRRWYSRLTASIVIPSPLVAVAQHRVMTRSKNASPRAVCATCIAKSHVAVLPNSYRWKRSADWTGTAVAGHTEVAPPR